MRVLAFLALLINCCYATHWAYGTLNWTRVSGNENTVRIYDLRFQAAFRIDFPWGSLTPNPMVLGSVVRVDPRNNQGSSYLGLQNCTSVGSDGRATCSSFAYWNIFLDVVTLRSNENWFKGIKVFNNIYLGPAASMIDHYSCCRLSSIADTNNDADWRVRTYLNPTSQFSPYATGLPRVYFGLGRRASFSVSCQGFGVGPFQLALVSTSTDSGLRITRPRDSYSCTSTGVQASGGGYNVNCTAIGVFTVDTTNKLINWVPKQTGLFAVQFLCSDLSTSAPVTSIPIDFIIEVTAQEGPYFYLPFSQRNPAFDSITARVVPFIRGVEGSFNVCATTANTAAQVIVIYTDGLPAGAVVASEFRPPTDSRAWCITIRWTPPIDIGSVDDPCFETRDNNNYPNFGLYCLRFNLTNSRILYVTGIIRDFRKNHTDFARNTPLDAGVAFVQRRLGTDRKPLWDTTVSGVQSTSARGLLSSTQVNPTKASTNPTGPGFYDWFFTDPARFRNLEQVLTLALVQFNNIFQFTRTSWWPIDNQLFGNEGDANNRYFTYEVNTYIAYIPGTTYRFSSSDDMLVFIENLLPTNPGGGVANGGSGWTLQGIHAAQSNTLDLDAFNRTQFAMKVNETYRCDIFYAHRNLVNDPSITIQLPNFTLCNGLSSGVISFDFTDFSAATVQNRLFLQGGAVQTNNLLRLIDPSSYYGMAFYSATGASPTKVPLVYGFRTEFEFDVAPGPNGARPEGFTLLLHNNDLLSPYSGGAHLLGYDQLAKTFVVEFDFVRSNQTFDSEYSWTVNNTRWYGECSVHTSYEDPNDPRETTTASLGRNTADPPLNFGNGTRHRVRLDYQTGASRSDPSYLRVYMNDNIRPITEVIVNSQRMSTMLGGSGYVALVGSNGPINTGTINIYNWRMIVVPVQPGETVKVQNPLPVTAGTTGYLQLRTRDACGNNIFVGGEKTFNANYTDSICPRPGTYPSTPITDNQDGTYSLPYTQTKASRYQFAVTLSGQTILDPPRSLLASGQTQQPFLFQVTPAPYSPPDFKIVFGEIPELYTTDSGQGQTLAGFTIAAFTDFGALRTGFPQVFDLEQSPARPGFRGDSTAAAAVLTSTTLFQVGDFIVIAAGAPRSGSLDSNFLSAISRLAGLTWSTTNAISYIGQVTAIGANSAASLLNFSSTAFESVATRRGSDTRSASFTRTFTISAAAAIAPCGTGSLPYARVNSIYDDVRVPAGTSVVYTVQVVDQYQNLIAQMGNTPSILLVPQLTQGTPTTTFLQGYYTTTLTFNLVRTYSLYLTLDGQNVAVNNGQYPVNINVVPGLAFLPLCTVIGSGVASGTAGVTATFDLRLADNQNNPIRFQNPLDLISGRLINTTANNGGTIATFSFQWVDDSSVPCTKCTLRVSYTTTVATDPGITDFSIELTINGMTSSTAFGSPTILAGPISYPQCTHECARVAPLQAGVTFSCNVRARDQYGNKIFITGTAFPAAAFAFSPAAFTFTLGTPISGVYFPSFVANRTGSMTLRISNPANANELIQNGIITYTISPGAAGPASLLTTTGSTQKAGTFIPISITSYDIFGNLRDNGAAQLNDYIVSLRLGPIVVQATTQTGVCATTGACAYTVRPTTPVGSYSLAPQVRTPIGPITGSAVFTIIPDDTCPNQTVVDGDGWSGCVESVSPIISTATFTLQTYDIFGNLKNDTVDQGLFQVSIRWPNGTVISQTVTNIVGNPTYYQITYVCPTLTAGSRNYVINVTHVGNTKYGPWTTTSTATISAAADRSYAKLTSISNVRVGETPSPLFRIIGCRDVNCLTKLGGCPTCYSARIARLDNSAVRLSASIATTSTAGEYSVSFVPLEKATWGVRIYENGSEPDESRSLAYNFTSITGFVDALRSTVDGVATSVQAGSTFSFTVTLRDVGSNIITGETVTFQVKRDATTVLASGTCTASGDSYTCNSNVTLAGTWSITVTSTGFKTGSGTLQQTPSIQVTAGPAAPSKTWVELDPGQSWTVVAGFLSTRPEERPGFIVKTQDIYGNPTLPNPSNFVFNLESHVANTADYVLNFQLTPRVFSGSDPWGVSDVVYVPTKIAPDRVNWLNITLNGSPILNQSLSVIILPASVSTVFSSVVTYGETVAGNDLFFRLDLKDIYGNPWFGGQDRLTISDNNRRPTTVVEGVSGGVQNASYSVTLLGIYTRVAWVNYSFTVAVDGAPLALSGLSSFWVVAGPVYAFNSVFSPTSTVRANEARSYSLATNDMYGNPCRTANNVAISWVWKTGRVGCDEFAESNAPNATDGTYVSNIPVYAGNGVYTLTFTAYIAGTYTWYITVNGNRAYCATPTSASSFQTVIANDPHPQTTYFVTAATSYAAGSIWTVRVFLRDFWNNTNTSYGAPLALGNNPSLSPYSNAYNPAQTATASTWLSASNGGASGFTTITTTDTGAINGQYEFQVNATRAAVDKPLVIALNFGGTWYAITGRLSSTQAPVTSVTIIPGVPESFTVTPDPITGTVGATGTFQISAADRYDNPVTSNSYRYIISFVRDPDVEGIVYQITATTVQQGNLDIASFISYWHGSFSVDIAMFSKVDGSRVNSRLLKAYIKHATCNFEDPTTFYRCANGNCVADVNQCGGTLCEVRCADGSCRSGDSCPCPIGTSRCNSTLTCEATCPPSPACPPDFPVTCGDGCRAAGSLCSSPVACPLGASLCNDGVTCALSLSECPTATCPVGQIRCAYGTCVNEASDCPTLKTCTNATDVVCPDGSCQPSYLNCPSIYPCDTNNAYTRYRCPDGSCRPDASSCPSPVTCPIGYLLCENNVCAKSLAECGGIADCPLDRVRCPDGSCQHNVYLCPSSITCPPDAPVKCADGTCRGSLQRCPMVSICPYFTCPDGSCVQCLSGDVCPDRCPSIVSCPLTAPTLCPDGSCVTNLASCPDVAVCPVALPWRCPDGSCRTTSLDCPTRTVCPVSAPVLCPDLQCAVAIDQCKPLTPCPTGEYRCPAGGCAPSISLCSTPVTCPVGTLKCLDGTCRSTCDNVYFVLCPQYTCPQTGSGIQCVSNLDQCPTSVVCPESAPVRCVDASCRATSSLCPAAPTEYPTSLVPCPDGRWAEAFTLCPTPVSCPDSSPYKCWDQTCRISPADCPAPTGCSKYQCPNGACVDAPWDPDCQTSEGPCRSWELNCAGTCVNATSCPDIFPPGTGSGSGSGTTSTVCSGILCRDGRCVTEARFCPAFVCPTDAPILCETDGSCADIREHCPTGNGCPYYLPTKCFQNGACISISQTCSSLSCQNVGTYTPITSPPSDPVTVDSSNKCETDGSCPAGGVSSIDNCYAANNCPLGQFRCADGTCVQKNTDCFSPTSGVNQCPPNAPVRCPNGFCTISLTACPPDLSGNNLCAGTANPVLCANGYCAPTFSLCPIIAPCTEPNTERCASGICRPPGYCPLANTCPAGSRRCFNGLCVQNSVPCELDTTTGCPSGWLKCPTGTCSPANVGCLSAPTTGNGCPSSKPVKCYSGECVVLADDCPLANGCPRTSPLRCSTDGSCVTAYSSCPVSCIGVRCANGTCVANDALCRTYNECPVSTPYRCADGSCKKYSAAVGGIDACSPTVVCSANTVLCADGSCAATSAFCGSSSSCPSGQTICPQDFACHENCATVTPRCPVTSPVLCSTGACVKNVQQCGSTSFGGSPPTICRGYTCFDGSCKSKASDCVQLVGSITGTTGITQNNDALTGACGSGLILCWNGACVGQAWQCPPVPACPAKHYRCVDGSCSNVTCTVQVAACTTGKRCEDGTCRTQCLGYDGCGLDKPYHCENRECASSPSGCQITSASRRLLSLPTATPTQACYSNCYAQIKAQNQIITVDVRRDISAVIATDANLVPITTMRIPSGALKLSSTSTSSITTFGIRTVPESRMRKAVNSVHPTRINNDGFQYSSFLSFAQSVVSPAFECAVETNVMDRFGVNLTVSSLVDSNRRLANGDQWLEDICLAYLFEVGQFASWRCIFSSQYDRRMKCPEGSVGCVPGKFPVRNVTSDPPPTNLVRSVIGTAYFSAGTTGRKNAVYAFITSPLAQYVPPPKKQSDPVQENILAIILGVIFGLIIIIGLIYVAARGYRYREKYKKEQKEAKDLREEVEHMRHFGPQNGAHSGDDQVVYAENPLAQRMADLKQAVNQEELKLAQAEQNLRLQESEIRGDHIGNIRQNRDNMLAELEKLKQQLREAQASDQRATLEADEPTSAAYVAGPSQDYGGGSAEGAYREGFDGYQAPRPQPKRKDF